MHEHFDIEPLIIRLDARMEKLWNRIERKEPVLYETTTRLNQRNNRDHAWWPRTASKVNQGPPDPIFT